MEGPVSSLVMPHVMAGYSLVKVAPSRCSIFNLKHKTVSKKRRIIACAHIH